MDIIEYILKCYKDDKIIKIMLEGNLERKMSPEEEIIRKRLEELLKKAEESENDNDLNEFKLELDDYLDQGYKHPKIKCYIFKYNKLIQKLSN